MTLKFNDFEIITRSDPVPAAISSRSDLERLSIALLRNEMPLPRPVRLLGVSLSALQDDEQDEPTPSQSVNRAFETATEAVRQQTMKSP